MRVKIATLEQILFLLVSSELQGAFGSFDDFIRGDPYKPHKTPEKVTFSDQ